MQVIDRNLGNPKKPDSLLSMGMTVASDSFVAELRWR